MRARSARRHYPHCHEEATPLILLVLSGLSLTTAALLLLAALPPRRFIAPATVALCVVGLLLTVAQAIVPGTADLAIPLGLPGRSIHLGLDGISTVFLLLLFTLGTAAATTAHAAPPEPTTRALPCFIGAMALTLLAADGFSLLLGFELMSIASFALILTHPSEEDVDAAQLYLGIAILAGACLVAATALLASLSDGGFDLQFAAIRAHPPEGARAVAILVLTLIGAGAKAGLAPLHVWLPPAHAAAPGHVSALMSGVMTKVVLYIVVRFLFDLCGPAQPLWWGVPLILAGAASAVLGGLRANLEPDIKSTLACSTIEHVGFIAIGLGLALCARAADLSAIAALALGGALLHVMAHGAFKGLLFLAAGAAQHETGTRLFSRLGGLIHRMPVTTAAALVGAASLAGLPLTAGFAGEWTLFQAALASPRIGGLWFQTLVCVVIALMALAAGLAASAAVRLIGIAFLGRPRTPRTAAAREIGPRARAAMIGLAAITALIGLFPGIFLGLAAPALRALAYTDAPTRAAGLIIAPQAGASGYVAPAIALLLALVTGTLLSLLKHRTMPGHRVAPAWDGGFGAAPIWLPFGDPLTQSSAASFAQPLRRILATSLLGARDQTDMPGPADPRPAHFATTRRDPARAFLFTPIARLRAALSDRADRMQFLTIRRTLSVMVAALVVFLAAIAIVEQL